MFYVIRTMEKIKQNRMVLCEDLSNCAGELPLLIYKKIAGEVDLEKKIKNSILNVFCVRHLLGIQ